LPTVKNLARNAAEHLLHVLTASLSLLEPLFCLSHKEKGKQTELDSLRCDVLDDDGVAQFKELL
jgi:hypothetical protein